MQFLNIGFHLLFIFFIFSFNFKFYHFQVESRQYLFRCRTRERFDRIFVFSSFLQRFRAQKEKKFPACVGKGRLRSFRVVHKVIRIFAKPMKVTFNFVIDCEKLRSSVYGFQSNFPSQKFCYRLLVHNSFEIQNFIYISKFIFLHQKLPIRSCSIHIVVCC